MKLKTYAKYIADLAKKYPNADVICASDEEGNSYQKVQFMPTTGDFDGADFNTDEDFKVNAICVN